MKSIKKTYHITAPIEDVWKALTDPKYIDEWGGGPAKMDDKVGMKFEFWGGDIHGTNREVIPHEKLVQDWFGDKWSKPSTVTFTLSKQEKNLTKLELIHENVPKEEVEAIDDGWDSYYLGPLKEFLENR